MRRDAGSRPAVVAARAWRPLRHRDRVCPAARTRFGHHRLRPDSRCSRFFWSASGAAWLVGGLRLRVIVIVDDGALGGVPNAVTRASDSDRNAIQTQLRSHCLAGRISVTNSSGGSIWRCGRRRSLRLRALVADLPEARPRDRADAGAPMPVGLPGVRPFIRQVVAPAGAALTRGAVLDRLAPALGRIGFELLEQSANGLVFERVSRNGWFSVRRERVAISLEDLGADQTLMIIHGRATRAVRKRFAELSF